MKKQCLSIQLQTLTATQDQSIIIIMMIHQQSPLTVKILIIWSPLVVLQKKNQSINDL